MLKPRLLTTLWGLPVVAAATWFGDPWFSFMIAVCGLLGAWEFYRMAAVKAQPLSYLGLAWTLLFVLSPHFGGLVPLLLTSLVVLSMITLVLRRRQEACTGWALTIAGVFYIGWLLSYLVALRGLDDGRGWVFLAVLATFASDCAAYLVGRAWGRHRMAPTISPGKTWEGAAGGAAAAIIATPGLALVFGLPLGTGAAVLLGLAISVFGQLGGLASSVLKRSCGVKDSGKLLPGHGGMLDRLDSILFAGVVVYYFVSWLA